MAALFDMKLRALRRDRAARVGPELFLLERTFDDCLERIEIQQRRFANALLIGCPDPAWPERMLAFADRVEGRDPGPLFSSAIGGETITEDFWVPQEATYDLVLAIGTLDTVNDLPLALRLLGHAMTDDALLIGALPGGDTLPQLRGAMRAADRVGGTAAPHVHPRIEASAVAPLLVEAGFIKPVVDVDRVPVSYTSIERLVGDLRAMGATNVLASRPHFLGKAARNAAKAAFQAAGDGERTVEAFEILHLAAWTSKKR
ncbi:MAG TPA: SAM-dependent methyltransferase [Sphingomicrobium sp.]|nr:SAM-dependent methyltransferase [Sphingomicrobium sp.]